MDKRFIIGVAIGVGIVGGILGVAHLLAKKPPEPPYTFLQIKDCPSGKGVETVFRHGALDPKTGFWHLQIGTESASFKPPVDCWTWITGVPGHYKGGDKLRVTDAASGSKR